MSSNRFAPLSDHDQDDMEESPNYSDSISSSNLKSSTQTKRKKSTSPPPKSQDNNIFKDVDGWEDESLNLSSEEKEQTNASGGAANTAHKQTLEEVVPPFGNSITATIALPMTKVFAPFRERRRHLIISQ
jgi:hypothetical protein